MGRSQIVDSKGKTLDLTAKGGLPVELPGIEDFVTGALTITATAVELKVGASVLTGRKQLIIYPPTAGTIYWGASNVTSANGAPLTVGDLPLEFSFANDTVKVYAVSDGTDRNIRVVESK